MVRTSRGYAGSRAVIVLGALAVLMLAAGCASGRGLTDACDPCAPCDPCGPTVVADPCAGAPPAGMPAGVGPGEAWCRVWVPPEHGQQVDTVCVKPASQKCIQIPAKYGTRPKLVCLQEAEMREKIVPAVWGVKQRDVVVQPAQQHWKKICCPEAELGTGERQCECWTKCETPPVVCTEPCPVCLSPERRCVQYIPPKYEMREERYLLQPAQCETICVPPVFEQRFRDVCIKPGYWEWRRNTDCEVPQDQVVAPLPAPVAPVAAPCTPPPTPLAALQVEMLDNAPSGAEAGQFAVGDVVRYDLKVMSDGGAQGLTGLRVLFTLPPELEYVSGEGAGLEITGAGQAAATSSFDLPVGGTQELHVLCRVRSVSPTNLVQLTASVRDSSGMELAVETESTTLTQQ